ncbi:expressed unknown protein [Ectocarpus siliculosus]|uniref:Uncharacterized protein n=1 Tax=Ectocarpus siliculosus TaxID=2880 RepID=D7FM92_ECTSI|nr:expressed unknown protein [Ectocarpus siliculosus]|eukprot:CBJ34239.1 expressed unknown protein [Ectocarpus siliculosus]
MTNKVCEEQVIQHVDLGSRGLTKCRADNTATTPPPTHPFLLGATSSLVKGLLFYYS